MYFIHNIIVIIVVSLCPFLLSDFIDKDVKNDFQSMYELKTSKFCLEATTSENLGPDHQLSNPHTCLKSEKRAF